MYFSLKCKEKGILKIAFWAQEFEHPNCYAWVSQLNVRKSFEQL